MEGESVSSFYIILSGSAYCFRTGEAGQEIIVSENLQHGDYFGEMAIIKSTLLTSTVECKEETTVLRIPKDRFVKVIQSSKFASLQMGQRMAVSAEVVAAIKHHGDSSDSAIDLQRILVSTRKGSEIASTIKDEATSNLLLKAFRSNILLANVPDTVHTTMVEVMYKKEVLCDESLIKEGDEGNCIYFVSSGSFEIFHNDSHGHPQLVDVAGKGSSFGELAMLYNAPRNATITSTEKSVVWVLEGQVYRTVLARYMNRKHNKHVEFLSNVPLFQTLSSSQISRIAGALNSITYEPGDVIVKQGDVGDRFFIVQSGSVHVSCERPSDGEEPLIVHLGDHSTGTIFGEKSLVEDVPRTATVTAIDTVQALYMSRDAFVDVMGPISDVLHQVCCEIDESEIRKIQAAKKRLNEERLSTTSGGITTSADLLLQCALDEFQYLGAIGRGSFGFVSLVKHKTTGQTYALKALNKMHIVDKGQQEHLKNEKNIMLQLDSPFITNLRGIFKDQDFIYFLLDANLGGELFSLLRTNKTFSLKVARFYAANVVVGLEAMHSKGIVWRDLKPENLLIGNDGYLKFIDFGFAKRIGHKRTYTLCGTPDYLPPEVLRGEGHNLSVDYWTLGVLIYEMLTGFPPFRSSRPMNTYRKILTSSISFPPGMDPSAKSIIKSLMDRRVQKRLGSGPTGIEELKKHEFFHSIDWTQVEKKSLKPPYIPSIAHEADLSHFAPVPSLDPGRTRKYVDDGSKWDEDF